MANKKEIMEFVEKVFGKKIPADTVPIVELSKADAAWILELNSKNRRISNTAVERYLKLMNAGNWVLGVDAVCITSCGAVGNGQHRLKAFLRSKLKTLRVMLRFDCLYGKEFPYMDRGKVRSVADATNLDKDLLACTNIMYYSLGYSTTFSVAQEAQVYTAEKLYEEFLTTTDRKERNKKMVKPPILAAYLAYRTTRPEEKQRLSELWDTLTARELPNGDPPETKFTKQMVMVNRLLMGYNSQSIAVRSDLFWRACHVFDSRWTNKNLLDDNAKEQIREELKGLLAPKWI
jgi:hypothetical protein